MRATDLYGVRQTYHDRQMTENAKRSRRSPRHTDDGVGEAPNGGRTLKCYGRDALLLRRRSTLVHSVGNNLERPIDLNWAWVNVTGKVSEVRELLKAIDCPGKYKTWLWRGKREKVEGHIKSRVFKVLVVARSLC